MKVRAKFKQGYTQIKVLAKHPMETGRRKDPLTAELIPKKYIQELICWHNNKQVFIAYLGTAVSKDPYFSFEFDAGQSGDSITLQWTDNRGKTLIKEAVIK